MFVPEYWEIMLPAMVGCLLITLIHGPLGVEVLRRGIIFIDLAIAQIAGLCVVLVDLWWEHPSWLVHQLAVVSAALLAAAFFRLIEKLLPHEQEAIIGASFVLAGSAVLLALANHPHGGEEIQDILSGQILFLSWTEVLAYLPVYVAATALWFLWPAVRQGFGFFAIFALVVTASVQLVGIYVVFASLILPALAVNTRKSWRPRLSISCGVLAVLIGITLSIFGDLPAGPVIVFAYAAVTILWRGFVALMQSGVSSVSNRRD